jgi:branched-chain amino acid transport system substrate-binding protein
MSVDHISRRSLLSTATKFGIALSLGAVTTSTLAACGDSDGDSVGGSSEKTLNLGVFTDTTGALAGIGAAHTVAYKMAMDDVNKAGGVLGKPMSITFVDSESDPKAGITKVRQLLEQKIDVLIGGIYSSTRDAVVPLLARQDSVYLYPMTYEGGACDDHMFVTGAVPVQNLIPAVQQVISQGAKSWVLIGHDYSFPHKANDLVRKLIEAGGGKVLDERYYPLDATDYSDAVRAITSSKPDGVVNLLTPPGMFTFYKQLATAGYDKPVVATGFDATVIPAIGADNAASTVVSLDYVEAKDSASPTFAERFGQASGDKVKYSPGLSCGGAYRAVRFAAAAANKAGSVRPADIRKALVDLTLDDLPGGSATLGSDHHTSMTMYVCDFTQASETKVLQSPGVVASNQPC